MKQKWTELIQALSKRDNFQTIAVCLAAVASGLLSVVYAKLFKLGEGAFLTLATEHREAIFIATPLAFGLSWFAIYYLSPEAGGSGIPQVLAANELEYQTQNQRFIDRLLSIRVLVVKVFTSLICVLGGGAIGREGPTLQISASLFHLFGRKTRQFFPDTASHLWIVSGAAAGLAAAFNTPLGGIVYAIEELGAHHFTRVRNVLLIAIIISGIVAQGILGDYLYIGTPKIFINGWHAFPYAVVVGFCGGLLGALWARVLFAFVQKRSLVKSKVGLGSIAVVCGLIMAGLIAYNPLSAGSGVPLINDLLFKDQSADLATIALRLVGTFVSYLSGTAGGIFSPSLAIGASLGSWFTQLFGLTGSHLLILLGMIGFLTGVTRVPFTSFILVLEMTAEHASIFPMMIAALFAILGANLVDPKSFYEHVKERFLASREGIQDSTIKSA